MSDGEMVEVEFSAMIRLFPEDVQNAPDLEQAVQNVIGGSGAKLIRVKHWEAI